MNWVDLVVITVVVIAGMWGSSTGFIAQSISLTGMICGLAAGGALAIWLSGHIADADTRAIVSIGVIIITLGLCYAGAATIGTHLRHKVPHGWARTVDAAAGTVTAMLGVALAAWLFCIPLAESPFPNVAELVRSSLLMRIVRGKPPPPDLLAGFRQALRESGFPIVFESPPAPFKGPSSPPDPAIADKPAVLAAGASTVKVLAQACGAGSEGSGWVYAPGHIATNAHVVAGAQRQVDVETSSGATFTGQVVAFDPARDIAVIAINELPLHPLEWTTADATNDLSVAALGYPQNGPFVATPGRIRQQLHAQGRDIYDRSLVDRTVYEVATRIRPGNSGGPLVSPLGTVYGMVFAASSTDPDTGYAIAGKEMAVVLTAAASASDHVPTGQCL